MASRLVNTARAAALELLEAGAAKTSTWTRAERNDWTRAVNALQRLSGKSLRFTVTPKGVRPYNKSPGAR